MKAGFKYGYILVFMCVGGRVDEMKIASITSPVKDISDLKRHHICCIWSSRHFWVQVEIRPHTSGGQSIWFDWFDWLAGYRWRYVPVNPTRRLRVYTAGS